MTGIGCTAECERSAHREREPETDANGSGGSGYADVEGTAGAAGQTVVLVGGIDRLEKHYLEEAERFGVALTVINRFQSRLGSRIGNPRVLILFTNKVSHTVRREVLAVAKVRKIPVLMRHSCGLCTFRDCLGCLRQRKVAER